MTASAPALPERDPDPAGRESALARQRERFRYLRGDDPANPFAPLAVSASLPLEAFYTPGWVLPYLPLLARAKLTELGARARHVATRLLGGEPRLRSLARMRGSGPAHAAHLGDLASDAAFARERLDGPNPLVIERVRDLAPYADFARSAPAGLARNLAPATAAAEGRLYAADYGLLREALYPEATRDSRWRPKYLATPVALFAQAAQGEPLEPLAVRIDGADPGAPVFWRAPGAGWELAKLYLRSADVNHHILSTHLQRTHYLLEPLAVSTPRQLSSRHPVYALLEPHLRFTLAVNATGNLLLQNEAQVFAQIYGGSLRVTRRVITASARRYDFARVEFETDLRARGMHDAPLDYPYRDDARLHLAAIRPFVEAYLALFYPTEASVAQDRELCAWLAELSASDGGALGGLPEPAALSRDALAQMLTQVIFTAGPGHAAVHFPQPDYHTAVGAFAAAAYAPPPRSEDEATAALHERALPPLPRAAAQVRNARLADFRYDRFGDYAEYDLGHVASAQCALAQFRAALREVEARIVARNRERPRPYPYLLPSRVPNSINL